MSQTEKVLVRIFGKTPYLNTVSAIKDGTVQFSAWLWHSTTWHSAYISVSTRQPNTHVFTPTDINERFIKTRPELHGMNFVVSLGDARVKRDVGWLFM